MMSKRASTCSSSGVGPPVAGYVRDITGSYDVVWWVALVLVLIGAVAFATAPDPNSLSQQRRTMEQPA